MPVYTAALCKVLVLSEMWVWRYNLFLWDRQDGICCPLLAQAVRSSSISKSYSHSGCVYARFTFTSSNWPDTSVSTNRSMNSRTWAESGFIAAPFSWAATQSKVLERSEVWPYHQEIPVARQNMRQSAGKIIKICHQQQYLSRYKAALTCYNKHKSDISQLYLCLMALERHFIILLGRKESTEKVCWTYTYWDRDIMWFYALDWNGHNVSK
jgi:hypothetical protein